MKRRLISGNLYNTVPKLVKLVSPLGIQQNYIIEKKYKFLSHQKFQKLILVDHETYKVHKKKDTLLRTKQSTFCHKHM